MRNKLEIVFEQKQNINQWNVFTAQGYPLWSPDRQFNASFKAHYKQNGKNDDYLAKKPR